MLLHRAAIDEGSRVPRDENENLGRVAKAIIADGDPVHRIGRNMIEENQPERESSEQIKPEITFGRNRGHAAFLSCGLSAIIPDIGPMASPGEVNCAGYRCTGP